MQKIKENCKIIIERLGKKHVKDFCPGRGRVVIASNTYRVCGWNTTLTQDTTTAPVFDGATAANPLGVADKCPESEVMPLSAIDMTAVFYGGLAALGDMAEKLGRIKEAETYRKKPLLCENDFLRCVLTKKITSFMTVIKKAECFPIGQLP